MRVLSVDGGGYLGLATAAFLSAVERHFGVRTADRFDLFCGTSTGAIIALALASGKTGDEAVALYEKLGRKVFWNPIPGVHSLRKVRGWFTSRYSNKALAASLKDTFQDMSLADLRSRGKQALVTAFNVSTGHPRLFKTDHSSGLTTDAGYLLRHIALASSAAPTYFPIVKLTAPSSGVQELFCDGGVFANHPALLGYVEAISELGRAPDQVSVLSLSTPRFSFAEHDSARPWFARLGPINRLLLRRGLVLWGSKLASIAIDGPAEVTHHALTRLARAAGSRYLRIQLAAPYGVEMDLATPSTTNTLKVNGSTEASKNEVRDELAPFYTG